MWLPPRRFSLDLPSLLGDQHGKVVVHMLAIWRDVSQNDKFHVVNEVVSCGDGWGDRIQTACMSGVYLRAEMDRHAHEYDSPLTR